VGTRDVSDTVSHSDYSETESDGDTEETDFTTGKNGGTATTKHQNECADQFGEEFVTCFHNG
jgi:hypothetical protein